MTSELLHQSEIVTVRRTFVSEMNNAVYLITHRSTGEQILIDAADEVPALRSLLDDGAADAVEDQGAKLIWILTTHAHWDHTRATAELAAETGAQLAIGAADEAQLVADRGVSVDRALHGGEHISIGGAGGITLESIALRGHTPGSQAFALEFDGFSMLFTGDSLFPGGVGNTNGDADRFTRLLTDVRERLFDRFGDETIVYPGHGAETTLGAERGSLPEWEARGW